MFSGGDPKIDKPQPNKWAPDAANCFGTYGQREIRLPGDAKWSPGDAVAVADEYDLSPQRIHSGHASGYLCMSRDDLSSDKILAERMKSSCVSTLVNRARNADGEAEKKCDAISSFLERDGEAAWYESLPLAIGASVVGGFGFFAGGALWAKFTGGAASVGAFMKGILNTPVLFLPDVIPGTTAYNEKHNTA